MSEKKNRDTKMTWNGVYNNNGHHYPWAPLRKERKRVKKKKKKEWDWKSHRNKKRADKVYDLDFDLPGKLLTKSSAFWSERAWDIVNNEKKLQGYENKNTRDSHMALVAS